MNQENNDNLYNLDLQGENETYPDGIDPAFSQVEVPADKIANDDEYVDEP